MTNKVIEPLINRGIFCEPRRHPYYVVAPHYTRYSAGVKVLHFLCHALNRMGENAYLIVHPLHYRPYESTRPDLMTFLLTEQIAKFHHSEGLTPITIYPETIKGNPFEAPFVVRYVMNYPGLLGGDREFNESEYLISYSRTLAKKITQTRQVFFLPASDPHFFFPEPDRVRSGACFYAGKHRQFHKGDLLPVTNGLKEITRGFSDSQTSEEIRQLFQSSELFYCYEDSALAIEAILCECPVVFLPNPYFTEALGKDELNGFGYSWGLDPKQIEKAKESVKLGRERYLKLFQEAKDVLQKIIEETQCEAEKIEYGSLMKLPGLKISMIEKSLGVVRAVRQKVGEKGLLEALKLIMSRSLRFVRHEMSFFPRGPNNKPDN